ncbi:MAG: hypothetical protein DWI05_05345 [Planctomycetota bacterium]|nr:MAG: hypothetical protein DWI05_05345 [Planctomycetota bacterium]
MTAGSLFGKDDRPASGKRWETSVRPLVWAPLAILLFVATSLPAQAQRPGRRWRTAPPPPRTQPAPQPAAAPRAQPSPKPSSTPKPATPGPQAGKPAGKGTPPPGKKIDNKTPQTTALPAAPPGPIPSIGSAVGSAALLWAGPAPFSAAWRVEHPGAWRPEEGAGEIVLAGGAREPTQVDPRGVELAAWTAREPFDGETAARSVLQASAESPAVDADLPAADLVVFPGADGALPVPRTALPAAEAEGLGKETVAADGTVSVLVRGKNAPFPAAEPNRLRSATVSLSPDDASSPWLPLGAFAAVPAGGEQALAPHLFLELSLHRDGTVRGNYFDAVSDDVESVAGRFDRETGSLTWRIGERGAEFETTADGLAAGRVEATVRRGTNERTWVLIGLP